MDGLSMGYGMTSEGLTICYECCAKQDESYMKRHGKIDLYWNGEHVTNWPRTLKFKPYAISKGKHNIARTREDVWFKFNSKVWHGVQYGEMTQVCHCKETNQ